MLTKNDGEELIKLAKDSIQSYFKEQPHKIPEAVKKRFSEKKGVFVTLKKGKQLRGCIGYIEPAVPLWKAVANAARHAAFGDPRFPATDESELKHLSFEISVLTDPEEMNCAKEDIPKKIKIGKHGIIIKKDKKSGLLLPQVFPELEVDAHSALEMTCKKAGLPAGGWTDKSTEVYLFECQIFSE